MIDPLSPKVIGAFITSMLREQHASREDAVERLRETAFKARRVLKQQTITWGEQQHSWRTEAAAITGKRVEEVDAICALASLIGTADYLRELRSGKIR